jgi:hypothetical protein
MAAVTACPRQVDTRPPQPRQAAMAALLRCLFARLIVVRHRMRNRDRLVVGMCVLSLGTSFYVAVADSGNAALTGIALFLMIGTFGLLVARSAGRSDQGLEVFGKQISVVREGVLLLLMIAAGAIVVFSSSHWAAYCALLFVVGIPLSALVTRGRFP